jgi:SAM-dependent methyltransferase
MAEQGKQTNAQINVRNLEKYVAAGDFARPWGEREWTPADTPYLVDMRARFLDPFVCPGKTIMEIGSGGGRMSQFLWDRGPSAEAQGGHGLTILVDGTEASGDAIRAAFGERLPRDGRILFAVCPDGRLPFLGNGSVDFVFSFDVFVHFHRDLFFAYLETVARVLKDGGFFSLHFARIVGMETPELMSKLRKDFWFFDYHSEREILEFLVSRGIEEDPNTPGMPMGHSGQVVKLFRKGF